jgi:predicted DsbA family dithiol-disulfide isomerase
MAVKAAGEQAADGGRAYLRRLREGALCRRSKLDHAEALVEEARAAGLDVERFRLALRSHGTTEAFAADLERARTMADAQQENPVENASSGYGGCALPTLVFAGGDDGERVLAGLRPYEHYREAAEAAGANAQPAPPPSVEQLVARFGRVSAREVELVCELPGPRAGAELHRLAEQWRLRPVKCGASWLWEAG